MSLFEYSDIPSLQGVQNDVNIHSTAKMCEKDSFHITYVKYKVASDETIFLRAVSENLPQIS